MYGQKSELHPPTPIQKILDEEFIYLVLSASTVTITRVDSAKSPITIEDKRSINFIKHVLLDDQTYIYGIKRSCPFIPTVLMQLNSSYRLSDRHIKPYMVTLNNAYCPKMQTEYKGAKSFMELSEQGWKKMSTFLNKRGSFSENNDNFRTQLLVLSNLLEKKDIDLIIALYKDKFFEHIDNMKRIGANEIKCNIILDGKNSMTFEQLSKQSLIKPIEAGMSKGELKLIKRAGTNIR